MEPRWIDSGRVTSSTSLDELSECGAFNAASFDTSNTAKLNGLDLKVLMLHETSTQVHKLFPRSLLQYTRDYAKDVMSLFHFSIQLIASTLTF